MKNLKNRRRLDIKKYAIEFVIIFISITLSFIVEEYRTNRQEKNVAKDFLQRLKAELHLKTLQTQKYLDINKTSIIGYERIAINFKTREIKEDTLYRYILHSEMQGQFYPEITTWESMKSSGIIASIKPEIIDSVNSLLTVYKRLEENDEFLNQFFLLTWPYFLPDIPATEVTNQWIMNFQQRRKRFLNIKQTTGEADLSKFLNNSIAVDYFFSKAHYAHFIENVFKSLPAKEKRLIELIEKEIKE